jgi:hypothetical protein
MADPKKSGKQAVPSRPITAEQLAAQKSPHGGNPYHGPDGRFTDAYDDLRHQVYRDVLQDSAFDRLTPDHPHVPLPPGASIRLAPETPQTHMHRIPPPGNKVMPKQKGDVAF